MAWQSTKSRWVPVARTVYLFLLSRRAVFIKTQIFQIFYNKYPIESWNEWHRAHRKVCPPRSFGNLSLCSVFEMLPTPLPLTSGAWSCYLANPGATPDMTTSQCWLTILTIHSSVKAHFTWWPSVILYLHYLMQDLLVNWTTHPTTPGHDQSN